MRVRASHGLGNGTGEAEEEEEEGGAMIHDGNGRGVQ